jgi:hypothetical protein
MDLFAHSWTALRAAVAELRDEDFARPCGCAGWLIRDLAYVLEWTLHHLDLTAHLPHAAPPPAAASLARSRGMLQDIVGSGFPPSFSDADALLVGTGRRGPSRAERSALGDLAAKLPLVLG